MSVFHTRYQVRLPRKKVGELGKFKQRNTFVKQERKELKASLATVKYNMDSPTFLPPLPLSKLDGREESLV